MSEIHKGGKAYIVVGGTGMGKTTFIKKAVSIVHPDNLLLYDVNNEYSQYYSKPLMPFKQFCEVAALQRDKLLVFEESTIFLSNTGSNPILIDILVRKRHTRNVIILVFHSFRSIPKYLFNLVNYVVIHKTADPLSKVEEFELPELTEAFNDIRNRQMLKGETKDYSPHRIVQIIP